MAISTHTPLARRDVSFRIRWPESAFLLTRLLRGVTSKMHFIFYLQLNFYSHASCEA